LTDAENAGPIQKMNIFEMTEKDLEDFTMNRIEKNKINQSFGPKMIADQPHENSGLPKFNN
jgi:hypothetical protein